MEPISLVFYAIVCGLLSIFAPSLGGTVPRMAVGAVVGVAAAAALPIVRGIVGY